MNGGGVKLSCSIRGVYSTALTELMLINGAEVILPSETEAQRFRGRPGIRFNGRPQVSIRDLDDCQGVTISGTAEQVIMAARIMQVFLFDAIFREIESDTELDVIFPYMAKANCDELRARVTATIPRHHRLRIVAPEELDDIETPGRFEHTLDAVRAGREIERRKIWSTFDAGSAIRFEHVSADGSSLPPRFGEIVHRDFTKRKVWIERRFSLEGPYNGLGERFQSGDYAITEIKEGAWFYRHTYFRNDGRLIGSYYNVNTIPEFYPGKVRYVDLGVDVIKAAEREAQISNARTVAAFVAAGHIGRKVADTAHKTARDIRKIADNQSVVPPFTAFTRGVHPVSRAETRAPR